MNFKTRLFGKPWQHKDAEQRAQAVSDQDDPELIQALAQLAKEDEAPQVRLAALKRIDTEASWLEARLRDTDADIQATADQHILRAALRSDQPEMRSQRLAWLDAVQSGETIRQLARSAPDLALRRAALQRVTSPGFLGDCYLEERDKALAGEILERIEQQSTLQRLQERLRKTSKQRAQDVASRLANLKAASGQADPDHLAAEILVQKIESLARGKLSGDRAANLEQLDTQWAAIRQPDPSLERRFRGAEAIVRAALARPTPLPETQQAPEPTPAEQSANGELIEVAEHIRERLRQARGQFEPAAALADWDRCWNRIKQPSESDQALKEEMLPILRELQAQVEFRARKRKEKETATEKSASDDINLNQRIDQLGEQLEQGDIAAAHALLAQLKSDFGKLSARARSQAITGRLQRMEGRLKEMRNWQHWSNNKHRDELIEHVERLAGSGQHPDAITAALKDARSEWQRLEKLEILPGERKRFAAPPGQWRRFQAACQAAFDQAKPYLEKRNEVQEDNLEKLDAFIAKGRALAQEEGVDSKVLLDTQRAARQAIRRLDDLPPRARGKAAARLRDLMDRISKRLDELFGQVEQIKRELIAEARLLSEEENLKVAIDKAKALQSRWQQAGTGRRKAEQKLWQEFRAPIEPLFDQLKGERDAQKQAEKAELAELKALCVQAEEIARVEESELESARSRMAAVADQWHAQGRKPGPLRQRFEQAQATLRQRLEQLARQAEIGARERIDALAAALQQVWQAREQGQATPESRLPSPQAGDPAEAGPLIERARELARTDPPELIAAQVAGHAEQAREVVVEMEFLSGLDTPEADQALRMDYQVKRLARRMSEGHALPALDDELEQLQARWLGILPMPESIYAELEPRFRRAREILLKMAGQ